MIGKLSINWISTLKCFDIGFENSQISRDPDKVIFNDSSHEPKVKRLCKGLMFTVPSKTLEYDDYLLPFELL